MMKRAEARGHLAQTMLSDTDRAWFGYDLSRAAGVRLGLMYRVLDEWLDLDYVEDEWFPQSDGPERRGYRLTDGGVIALSIGADA